MERPIVVDSVLCFIHNFRQLSNIRFLVKRSFSESLVSEARSALLRRTSPLEAVHLPEDVVDLYDVFSARENLVFAATDLNQMPLVLSPADNTAEIIKEIKSLKSYFQETLEGKADEVTSQRDSITPTTRCKLNTSASSPEFPTPTSQLPVCEQSPKPLPSVAHSPLSLNLSQQPVKRKANRSLDATVRKLCEKVDEQATASPAWQPAVDPQAYLNMIRMMQTPSNTSIFGNMMGNMSHAASHPFVTPAESSGDDNQETMEDGESSPSPSEEIKDDFPLLEMSVDNDSDKPFICEHSNCQKRFANKFLLKKHQFIHTGLRPHSCPFCNKRFNRKDNLLRHKKTHLQNGTIDEAQFRAHGLHDAINGLMSGLTPPLLPDFKLESDEFSLDKDVFPGDKEPLILGKEAFMDKESLTMGKELLTMRKEPFNLSQELLNLGKEKFSLNHEPLNLTTEPFDLRKDPFTFNKEMFLKPKEEIPEN